MKHIRNYTSFIAFLIIVLSIILYFHPTVSPFIFPWKRQMMLKSFISSVQDKKSIDPQTFWEFREFYFPGSLTVVRTGIKTIPIFTPSLISNPLYFIAFRSKYIQSDEFLVTSNSLREILGSNKYNTQGSYLISEEGKKTVIFFVKPISEMVTANGFYDYKDKDKQLLNGKYWFVFTTIDR